MNLHYSSITLACVYSSGVAFVTERPQKAFRAHNLMSVAQQTTFEHAADSSSSLPP